MSDAPLIVCRVVRPLRSPLAAAPGDFLTAWPGHPTHALAVVSPDHALIRWRPCADDALYRALLDLWLSARIQAATVEFERRLLRVA